MLRLILKLASRVKESWLLVGAIAGLSIFFQGCGPDNADNPSVQLSDSNAGSDDDSVSNKRVANPNSSAFPALGQSKSFNAEVDLYSVSLERAGKSPMMLNIFVPAGNHKSGTLPVVFEAPAGTTLLHGIDIDIPNPNTEYLPFTDAGMIAVTYPIDGKMSRDVGPDAGAIFMITLSEAYKEFVAADAGVDNGKLAIDFVLAQVPMADPKRLYTWGHSSAATLALLLASKDDRIAKCIAMAPATDLSERLGEITQEPVMGKLLPNLTGYLKSGSPITYVDRLRVPVFVAHAMDDDNEPFQATKKYVQALRNGGGDVTFHELSRGGHYKPLLDAAIPTAVKWLKQ